MNCTNRITAAVSVVLTLMLSACATSPTEQQSDEHAAHQHSSDAASSTETAQDAEMAHMHGNMQKMQELMTRIHAAKDPTERQRLMAEHRAAMRSQMQGMHGMMTQGTCPMMGGDQDRGSGGMKGGMKGGQMGGKKGGMMGKGSAQHQCPMMGHMQMMHGMMEQMMEHMSAEHGDKQDAPDQKQQEHVH